MGSKVLWVGAALLAAGCATTDTGRWVVNEHELVPVEPANAPPPPSEDVTKEPEWDYPRKHLAAGQDYIDPFIGIEPYPELSASLDVLAAHVDPRGETDLFSQAKLNLWVLELRFPIISQLDGPRFDYPVQAALKLPFELGNPQNRMVVSWGASIASNGPALSESSRFDLLYAFGGGGFDLQLRGGYGHEQLFVDQPLRVGLLYGGLVGMRLGNFQPLVEVDGFREDVDRGNRIVLLPGLRYFPNGEQTLQLGVAGVVTFTGGRDTPDRRYGGFFEVGYNFM